MRNNYCHQKIHSKHFYFLDVTFPTRQAALHSFIKNKIANAKEHKAETKNFV